MLMRGAPLTPPQQRLLFALLPLFMLLTLIFADAIRYFAMLSAMLPAPDMLATLCCCQLALPRRCW